MNDENTQTYTGGCHCGAVRFEATCAPIDSAMECNCSHCAKKGFLLTFLPRNAFAMTQGEDALTEYRFNNKVIAHQFCSICGTQPFGFGADESGNEIAAVNVRCVDDIDLDALSRTPFNGKGM